MSDIRIASAVVNIPRIDCDGRLCENWSIHSESIGIILVTPIHKNKTFLRKESKIVGHKEVVTGEQITERDYYSPDGYNMLHSDLVVGNKCQELGHIAWVIYDWVPVSAEYTEEQIKEYLSQTPEEVKENIKKLEKDALGKLRDLLNSNQYKISK